MSVDVTSVTGAIGDGLGGYKYCKEMRYNVWPLVEMFNVKNGA